MEFTGTYYRCNECESIWDYNDLCPDCASDNQEELNAREVFEQTEHFSEEGRNSILKMLESHDDLN